MFITPGVQPEAKTFGQDSTELDIHTVNFLIGGIKFDS